MIQEPVVIIANGNFPTHPTPLGILKDANTIICCDGAVNEMLEKGLEPHYILGDMDSINDVMRNKFRDRIIELPDQYENDLRKAIIWIENNGTKKAIILGATGKRDDHSLANIFTLLQYPSQMELMMYSNNGIFSLVENEQKFDSFIGEQISLFSANPEIELTTTNLKYNLNNKTLHNLYCGSLNESIDESFTISLSQGKILVYQVFA